MATSTQQKQELFKSIWAIANELRGSISLYGLPIPQQVPKWNDFQTVMHQSEKQLTNQIA